MFLWKLTLMAKKNILEGMKNVYDSDSDGGLVVFWYWMKYIKKEVKKHKNYKIYINLV